jgi:hypothetical protein
VVYISLLVNFASANVEIYPWDIVVGAVPIITVNSPLNNTLLYANSLLLNFTVTKPALWVNGGTTTGQMLTGFGYIFDGKSYGSFPTSSDLSTPFNYFANLTLDKGLHTLQVYENATGYVISGISGNTQYFPITSLSNTIHFETLPAEPTVEVQSLDLNGTSLSLNFTVDEPVTKLTYSLDNQDNVSIAGNTTLTNLPYGSHNITIYATNPAGNVGASQIFEFTVAKPESFPTLTVAAVSGAVAVALGAGLLLYRRKHTRLVKR